MLLDLMLPSARLHVGHVSGIFSLLTLELGYKAESESFYPGKTL